MERIKRFYHHGKSPGRAFFDPVCQREDSDGLQNIFQSFLRLKKGGVIKLTVHSVPVKNSTALYLEKLTCDHTTGRKSVPDPYLSQQDMSQ